MEDSKREKEDLEQRLARLEERLEIYEKIDKKIKDAAVDNLSGFRVYLTVLSVILTLLTIMIAGLSVWGTASLREAKETIIDSNRKVDNLGAKVRLSEHGSGILLGGYDVVVLNRALLETLKEKKLLNSEEISEIMEVSRPRSVNDLLTERGIVSMEKFALEDQGSIGEN